MIHLALGIPAGSIRLAPFVPAVNHIPLLGATITAGVLSSGLDEVEETAHLFVIEARKLA